MVKDFTQMKNSEQIKKLLRVLGQDFTMSQMLDFLNQRIKPFKSLMLNCLIAGQTGEKVELLDLLHLQWVLDVKLGIILMS